LKMKREYLEPLCRRRAEIIFDMALQRFNYPKDYRKLDEVRDWCKRQVQSYSSVEQEIIMEEIENCIRKYKCVLRDYQMSWW